LVVSSRWAADVKGEPGKEVASHLRLLERAGVVNTSTTIRVLETFDQVRAMTWRLIHPKT
jgi:hypothetical protein